MKFRLKSFSVDHYLHYMRRQSKHVQHIHALAFAGIVTSLTAGFILYTDYGFWHETYTRDEKVATSPQPTSLKESLSTFFSEVKTNFNSIGSAGADLLESKETFTR